MHLWFVLELSYIDLWNIDLLDIQLDLLDIDIPSKYFVCLHNAFKMSSWRLQDMSSRHLHDLHEPSRHIQCNNFSSSKTSWKCLFKTYSRRLPRCIRWTCKNRKEKKLFSIRTKLSYCKVFHRKCKKEKNEKRNEMKKDQILMNKPVYLGVSILYLNKTLIYELWYDYIKPKYGENSKICYMDADNLSLFM